MCNCMSRLISFRGLTPHGGLKKKKKTYHAGTMMTFLFLLIEVLGKPTGVIDYIFFFFPELSVAGVIEVFDKRVKNYCVKDEY